MIHQFKVALAQEYGIEEAILIHNFFHWIADNKANDRNFFDGRFWTYNTQKAYKDLFPYLNESKIKRIINSLVEKGILMKGNYNANQYDRTNWYAFTDEGFAIVQKCYIHWTKMTNGRVENVPPIPNNKPNNKPNIYFASSDEDTDDRLFDDAETSTITMLSSEKKLPYGAQGKVDAEEQSKMFEDLWLMYERKGSKAAAKKEFAKLTEEEIATMRSHIPAYLQSRPERQYRQDFERYIKHKTFNSVVYSKQNTVLFDPEAANTSATQAAPQEFSRENETLTINGVTYR
jgi:hypothetical protein